jgi:hypothetical protein
MNDDFDFGVPESDMKSYATNCFIDWPKKGELTGLVDADGIPYNVGYTSTEIEYLKFKNSDKPYESDVWKAKCDHASYLLNSWLEAAGCDSCLLYLTDGKNNFRHDIATLKPYKGQRKEEKPPFFHEIKEWVHERYAALMSDGCEADDDISKEAWKRHKAFAKEHGKEMLWTTTHMSFCGFVIISKDKDLNIIPGKHLEPGQDKLQTKWVIPIGDLDPKWAETEINDYEFWPLFDKEPINPKHLCTVISHHGKIKPIPYHQIKEDYTGWEKKYIWFELNSRGTMRQQDTFIRGKNKGEGKYKRFKVGRKKSQVLDKLRGSGLTFFYSQLITGDGVDNYPGIPGQGPKKAYDLLYGAKSEDELCERVYSAYLEYYRKPEIAYERMLEQGRLAHMQTYKGDIWKIPKKGESSFPI